VNNHEQCECCSDPHCEGCCAACEASAPSAPAQKTSLLKSATASGLSKHKCIDGCISPLVKDACGNCIAPTQMPCTDSIENKLFPPVPNLNRLTAQEIKDLRKIIERVNVDSIKERYFLKLQYKVPYQNQRNNNQTQAVADRMCNVTEMSQCFEYSGKMNPDPTMQYADYLYKLWHDKKWNSPAEDKETRIKIAKELKVTTNIRSIPATKQAKIDTLNHYLKKGYGVMLSVYGKDRGHFIRVIAADNNKLTFDDPYGKPVDPAGRNTLKVVKDASGNPLKSKVDASRDSTNGYVNDGYHDQNGKSYLNSTTDKGNEETGSQGMNCEWTWGQCDDAIFKFFDAYKPE